jgi:hypothetical protein
MMMPVEIIVELAIRCNNVVISTILHAPAAGCWLLQQLCSPVQLEMWTPSFGGIMIKLAAIIIIMGQFPNPNKK